MSSQVAPRAPRPRDAGVRFGGPPTGPCNAITDVPGVTVGHETVWRGQGGDAVRTGVTAVLPHPDNLFRDNVTAAVHTINGFGKPTGWPQVEELGKLETPIVLTNTLSVGAAFTGVVRHALAENPGVGGPDGTVNPVVAECNDGDLSAIRSLPVTSDHVLEAIRGATGGMVAEGSVGAGTGMTCYGWKGGIGTASRSVNAAGLSFIVGALVLANFGRAEDLTIRGVQIGSKLSPPDARAAGESGGSIVCVLATDCPFDARQLTRLARRAQNGIARTGGNCEHGSGEFVVAFSTTCGRGGVAPIPSDEPLLMNSAFRAVADSVEEAIVNALFAADTVTGIHGRVISGLPREATLRLLEDVRESA
jgi:D-aminopeptidase